MTTQTSNPLTFIKTHKGLTFLCAFVLFIILTFTIGIQIPKNMTDGTEGLTGDALTIAKEELNYADSLTSTGMERMSSMHFKIRVEDVHSTSPSEKDGLCGYGGTISETEGHYSMKISFYSFYGIKTEEWEMQNCHLPNDIHKKNQ